MTPIIFTFAHERIGSKGLRVYEGEARIYINRRLAWTKYAGIERLYRQDAIEDAKKLSMEAV